MDFDKWWKIYGQFSPPVDRMLSDEMRQCFKLVAAAAWREAERESEAEIARLERELDESAVQSPAKV